MTRRVPATTALVVLLALEAAAGTAGAVVLVAVMVASDGPLQGPLDPTAIGVLTVGLSMLAVVIALLCASAVGLWRGRDWAPTTAGIVQALFVVGGAVGWFSAGWQPVLLLVIAVGALGLLLLIGRMTRLRSGR